MYEGGLRVPFVAAWPGVIKPGSVNENRFAFWDLLATFAELTGQPTPEGTDGVSILSTLTGKGTQKLHDFMYWESPGYGGQQALISGHWKVVRQQLGKGVLNTELYDLKLDPNEAKNVAAKNPEIVRKLEAMMAGAHTPSRLFPLPTIDFKPMPKKTDNPKKS